MTNDYRLREDDVIDRFAAGRSERGYTVVRRPTRRQLPDFLRPYEPDALAVGREPQLVIEVVRDDPVDDERVRRIQKALEGRAGWRLELLYDRDGPPPRMAPASLDEIGAAIRDVRKLTDVNEVRAALLVAWAMLEALARALEPTRVERPQTPDAIVEVLASLGHVLPGEADRLRTMVTTRNALAHGRLGIEVGAAGLGEFTDVLESLAAVARERALVG